MRETKSTKVTKFQKATDKQGYQLILYTIRFHSNYEIVSLEFKWYILEPVRHWKFWFDIITSTEQLITTSGKAGFLNCIKIILRERRVEL